MITILLALALSETFTGIVTDTMCGAHHNMMKDQPDEKCIAMCVKGSSEYALYDGQHVYELSDPGKSSKFAAQKVKVTGTLNPKTKVIKISTIERVDP